MMEQEVKNEQGEQVEQSAVVENTEVAKYSFLNWALFALPGVMLFYPFKWLLKYVLIAMEMSNADVRHAREQDAEHNRRALYGNKRDRATSLGLMNLLVFIVIVGAIFVGVKLGLDATMYLFTIPGFAFLLPIYFIGLYAAFKPTVLNEFTKDSKKCLQYVFWTSIPLALIITLYVWSQGAFKSGHFHLGFVFGPLFIFCLFVLPFVLSMFSLFIYLTVSSKTAQFKLAIILPACFSLLASSATYFIVTGTSLDTKFAKFSTEKWPKKAEEEGPSPHDLHRMKIEEQLRLKVKKAQEDAERVGGYESYPRSMVKKISSIHNGHDEALQAMSANKGKGIVDVYIQPFPFNNGEIKIAVEGIESYEYGMQMTPGTRKVTVVQEGYETVEFTAKMDEGGFYETVNMIPIE